MQTSFAEWLEGYMEKHGDDCKILPLKAAYEAGWRGSKAHSTQSYFDGYWKAVAGTPPGL